MESIWIIDDDQSIRFVLGKALAREAIESRLFDNITKAQQALETAARDGTLPRVLVSDIRMPGGSGLDLLKVIKQAYPALPVIIMTAYSDLESAVAAFQGGAVEYLSKPFDLTSAVGLIRRMLDEYPGSSVIDTKQRVDPEVTQLSQNGIIGQASAMQSVFRAIGRLSQSQVTVLITGESGTGKELVAHALHRHSPRAGAPFIAINTAAIPKDLLENELFGHEKGAFTGAQSLYRGRFEQADGGTLFLDEIGDMPFDLQTRLLRVLSDGSFYRVGGQVAIKTNVRVIAATNQNLEERVKAGLFREDLYHRLHVIHLRLPSLRERREDIPLLARHFLRASARQLGGEPKQLAGDAQDALMHFDFPGNVRQLENICHWLTVMAPSQLVQAKDLPQEVLQHLADASAPVVPVNSIVSGRATFSHMRSCISQTVDAATGQHSHGDNGDALLPLASGEISSWETLLEAEVLQLLEHGQSGVWDEVLRRVELSMIRAALHSARGKRIEAAKKLGIGRNTITRKIQDLEMGD